MLILIEAAASYGKTCSAFEIMNCIAHNSPGRIPMLTELSRNRTARIFRYVLLDEINKSYPTLNYDLVRSHIHKSNVILIIDGFDELLHRNNDEKDDFENVEPMLETIKELLNEKAKVILTTRKTAIFSGDEFHIWIEEHTDDFDVVRYEINKPTASDWLGYDRCNKLEQCGFPVYQLSNPVLLSFLKSLEYDEFCIYCENQDRIINVYLDRLLEREKERQHLLMNQEEQLAVVKKIGSYLISEDISTITKKELLKQITNRNIDLLNEVRSRYIAETKPSIEELATKLSMHAFFDRKGSDESLVGFINDFIFGLFIAMDALEDETDEWITNEYFVDLAVTSYIAQEKEKQELLWDKLKFMFDIFPSEFKVRTDIILIGRLCHNYSDCTFNQLRLDTVDIPGQYRMANTTFVDCQFKNVKFNKEQLDKISFINCKFFKCDVINNIDESVSIELYNCTSDPPKIEFIHKVQVADKTNSQNSGVRYDRLVLERFWQQGRAHFKKKKAIRTLFTGISSEHHRNIGEAIESLKRTGLLHIEGDWAYLDVNQINEIREILGR